MAATVDNDLGPRLTENLNERLGRAGGEAVLANHPPARKVGGKRVTNRKTKEPVVQLPCAVRVGWPESKLGETYRGLSKHNEHINRVHSEEAWCKKTDCMKFFKDSAAEESHSRSGCQSRVLTSEEREAYPTLIPNAVLVEVRNWKVCIKDEFKNSEDGLVVSRWKGIVDIIYPGKKIPGPVSISSASPRPPRGSQPSAPQLPTPPSSEQARGKRQASSSPVGKPLGLRRKPGSPEPQTTDEEAEHVDLDASLDGLRWPQPNRGEIAPLKEQLPEWVGPGLLYYSPYSADDFQPRLPQVGTRIALPRRETTKGTASLVFSNTADSIDDFFRPQTPSARPPAQDEENLTFGAGGVGPDRGLEYLPEVPDGELDGNEGGDGEFADLFNLNDY